MKVWPKKPNQTYPPWSCWGRRPAFVFRRNTYRCSSRCPLTLGCSGGWIRCRSRWPARTWSRTAPERARHLHTAGCTRPPGVHLCWSHTSPVKPRWSFHPGRLERRLLLCWLFSRPSLQGERKHDFSNIKTSQLGISFLSEMTCFSLRRDVGSALTSAVS